MLLVRAGGSLGCLGAPRGSGLWLSCWDHPRPSRGVWEQGHTDTLCLLVVVAALPPPLRAEVFPVEASSTVIISPELFSEENGQIQYYGVIATTNESRECPCRSQAVLAPWRAAGALDVPLVTVTLHVPLQC